MTNQAKPLLPFWATSGDITEPNTARKALGWEAGDRPPAQWLNYWMNNVYQNTQWLEQRIRMHSVANPRPRTSQVKDIRALATNGVTASFTAAGTTAVPVWVEVGDDVLLAYSKDTITWVQGSVAIDTGGTDGLFDVIWVPSLSLFVAGGGADAIADAPEDPARIYTSPDGVTWTSRSTPSAAGGVFKLLWDSVNSLIVAVGAGGWIITSPTGVTWTQRTSGFSTSNINDVCQIPGGALVAVGAGGKISTSTNGTTWTSRTSGTSNILRRCKYLNGAVWAVGDDNAVVRSTDGTTWASKTTGAGGTTDWYDLASIDTTFEPGATGTARIILVGDTTAIAQVAYTENDGTSWVYTTLAGHTKARSIAVTDYGGISIMGVLQAISVDGGKTYLPAQASDFGAAAACQLFANGRLVIGGAGGAIASTTPE